MVYNKVRLQHALKAFRETASWRNPVTQPTKHLERRLRTRAQPLLPVTSCLWQEEGTEEGSDDEEYHPTRERRQLKGSKPRNNLRKRKAEEICNQEFQQQKKRKGEDRQAFGNNSASIVLKLTTESGFRKFIELARTYDVHDGFSDHSRTARGPPIWFEKYADTVPTRKRDKEVKDLMDMDIDAGSRVVDELYKPSLRSGKEIKHKPSQIKIETDGGVQPLSNPNAIKPDGHVMSWISIVKDRSEDREGSKDQPILLDSSCDDDCEVEGQAHNILKSKARSPGSKPLIGNLRPAQISGELRRRLPEQVTQVRPRQDRTLGSWARQDQPASYHNQPSIFPLTTSYAHPIDFKYRPPSDEKCEFCCDYRISVLGYGKMTISAFVDPDRPLEYQEAGDGHRSRGKRPTRMCVACALARLMTMRCHRQKEEDNLAFGNGFNYSLGKDFQRIKNVDYSPETLNSYSQHLLSRDSPARSRPVIPICSLCATPAQWECCKYQKLDRAKRPCETPSSAEPATPVTSSKQTQALPSTEDAVGIPPTPQSSPVSLLPRSSTSSSIDQPKTQPTTPPTTPSPSPPNTTHPLILNPPHPPLRPPIQGCGLTLCKQCRDFVVQTCKGVLDKKKVWTYLRTGKTSAWVRADVEWLFEGSLLERTYEQKQRW